MGRDRLCLCYTCFFRTSTGRGCGRSRPYAGFRSYNRAETSILFLRRPMLTFRISVSSVVPSNAEDTMFYNPIANSNLDPVYHTHSSSHVCDNLVIIITSH
jgi:hypothetical protein